MKQKNSENMDNLKIVEASGDNYLKIAQSIKCLLVKLEPDAAQEINLMNLCSVTKELLSASKIFVYLAKVNDTCTGVITLHECAARDTGIP